MWATPWPSITRPLSGPRASRRTSRVRSATGLGVMRAQARAAHSWRRIRGTAANVARLSGSGPFGGTTESSTSASTWLG